MSFSKQQFVFVKIAICFFEMDKMLMPKEHLIFPKKQNKKTSTFLHSNFQWSRSFRHQTYYNTIKHSMLTQSRQVIQTRIQNQRWTVYSFTTSYLSKSISLFFRSIEDSEFGRKRTLAEISSESEPWKNTRKLSNSIQIDSSSNHSWDISNHRSRCWKWSRTCWWTT